MTTAFQQPAAGQFRPPIEGVAGRWANDVIQHVKYASATAPRTIQHAVGPSELGTPCTRRLAYRLLDWEPKPNSDTDPWASMVGTGIHAELARIYQRRNHALGHTRYLLEQQVTLPHGIKGHCDLYDTETGDVVDWKTTGKVTEYRKNGPGVQYQTQAHLYGLGMAAAGHQPVNVVIVFLPRTGRIDGVHVWAEPYNSAVAEQALDRYQAIFDFHQYVNPEEHPERWAWLATADAYCTYCPWYLPGSRDLASGCQGHQETPT